MRRILRFAQCVALAAALAAPLRAQEPTVVFLVRHAERLDQSRDPVLAPAGDARALALAQALADARVGVVITTQFQRTRLTAAPLAQTLGLTPVIVEAGGGTPAHVQAVADAVRRHPGRTILVVGHSNTIPPIVTALGGPALPNMCDNEHSLLFTLVIRPGGEVSLLRSKYGAEDGPPPADCRR